jgi:hypothetical protein
MRPVGARNSTVNLSDESKALSGHLPIGRKNPGRGGKKPVFFSNEYSGNRLPRQV